MTRTQPDGEWSGFLPVSTRVLLATLVTLLGTAALLGQL